MEALHLVGFKIQLHLWVPYVDVAKNIFDFLYSQSARIILVCYPKYCINVFLYAYEVINTIH